MSAPDPSSQPASPANSSAKPAVHRIRRLVLAGIVLLGICLLIPAVRNGAFALIRALVRQQFRAVELPGMAPAPPGTQVLDTGLTNAARLRAWHRLAEGSDVFPVALFRALKDPETKQPLIQSFTQMGFVPSPNPKDKTGLPVGFSRVVSDEILPGIVLGGLNCAACHSTQITYHGHTLHIDGAPNVLDIEAFFRRTVAALQATLDNPTQWVPFLARFVLYNEAELASYNAEQLKAATRKPAKYQEAEFMAFLRSGLERFKIIVKSFDDQTPALPGRADSFGIIRNLLMTKELTGADNFKPMTAPVSIPHLFGFGSFTNLHWDGNTTSPFDRNFAQAVALGAKFDPHNGISTCIPGNLATLEIIARQFQPPQWPHEFPALDAAKVARGADLFRVQCAACHTNEGWYKLANIGTDPNRLVNYNTPLNGKEPSYAKMLYDASTLVKTQALRGYTKTQIAGMETWHPGLPVQWIQTLDKGYFIRGLRGVWTTAPYLHNGSVPTLWDLLQPPGKRPVTFSVGQREFDPKKVGYMESGGRKMFDTRLDGNHNTGHPYGTQLPDQDKWALIEYLKGL